MQNAGNRRLVRLMCQRGWYATGCRRAGGLGCVGGWRHMRTLMVCRKLTHLRTHRHAVTHTQVHNIAVPRRCDSKLSSEPHPRVAAVTGTGVLRIMKKKQKLGRRVTLGATPTTIVHTISATGGLPSVHTSQLLTRHRRQAGDIMTITITKTSSCPASSIGSRISRQGSTCKLGSAKRGMAVVLRTRMAFAKT